MESHRATTIASRHKDYAVQSYKFSGKEFDRMSGLNFYDFHARQYDPSILRFTSQDPLAEKYPSLSPYAYCANNPLMFSDPTGERIYVLGEEYTYGAEFEADNAFGISAMRSLNLIYENGGQKLLDDLIRTDNRYDINKSKNGKTYTTPNYDSDGKYIGAEINLQSGMTEGQLTTSIAHEAMHGAQYEFGQGGPYFINEIEAYAYEGFIGYKLNDKYPSRLDYVNSLKLYSNNTDNAAYDRIVSNYISNPYTPYITESYLNANFKQSIAYGIGLYNNYKNYYPFNRKTSIYTKYRNIY